MKGDWHERKVMDAIGIGYGIGIGGEMIYLVLTCNLGPWTKIQISPTVLCLIAYMVHPSNHDSSISTLKSVCDSRGAREREREGGRERERERYIPDLFPWESRYKHANIPQGYPIRTEKYHPVQAPVHQVKSSPAQNRSN